jgi:hypothetical protein
MHGGDTAGRVDIHIQVADTDFRAIYKVNSNPKEIHTIGK